jgi:hypothetical protein
MWKYTDSIVIRYFYFAAFEWASAVCPIVHSFLRNKTTQKESPLLEAESNNNDFENVFFLIYSQQGIVESDRS